MSDLETGMVDLKRKEQLAGVMAWAFLGIGLACVLVAGIGLIRTGLSAGVDVGRTTLWLGAVVFGFGLLLFSGDRFRAESEKRNRRVKVAELRANMQLVEGLTGEARDQAAVALLKKVGGVELKPIRAGAWNREVSQALSTWIRARYLYDLGKECQGMEPYRFESTEVRWFGQGALPLTVDVLAAKFPGRPAPRTETRRDLYLVSDDPAVGIKLRDGKLEIKSRRFADGASDRLPGSIEEWVKWSWDDAGKESVARDTPAHWKPVEKERAQWKFSRDGAEIRVVSGTERVGRGGAIELTEIKTPEGQFWTIAVEAFSHGGDARVDIGAAAAVLLGVLPEGTLTAEASRGYAEWLSHGKS